MGLLQRNGTRAAFTPFAGPRYRFAIGASPLSRNHAGVYAFDVTFDVVPGRTSNGRLVERWEQWIFDYVEVGIITCSQDEPVMLAYHWPGGMRGAIE
jgi:hypothetical protein